MDSQSQPNPFNTTQQSSADQSRKGSIPHTGSDFETRALATTQQRSTDQQGKRSTLYTGSDFETSALATAPQNISSTPIRFVKAPSSTHPDIGQPGPREIITISDDDDEALSANHPPKKASRPTKSAVTRRKAKKQSRSKKSRSGRSRSNVPAVASQPSDTVSDTILGVIKRLQSYSNIRSVVMRRLPHVSGPDPSNQTTSMSTGMEIAVNEEAIPANNPDHDNEVEESSGSDVTMNDGEEALMQLRAANEDLQSERQYYRLMAEIAMKSAAVRRGCKFTINSP